MQDRDRGHVRDRLDETHFVWFEASVLGAEEVQGAAHRLKQPHGEARPDCESGLDRASSDPWPVGVVEKVCVHDRPLGADPRSRLWVLWDGHNY